MNYQEAFENGKEKLMRAGVDEYALDARLLLECVCGTDHSALLAHPDRVLTGDEEALFELESTTTDYPETQRLIKKRLKELS